MMDTELHKKLSLTTVREWWGNEGNHNLSLPEWLAMVTGPGLNGEQVPAVVWDAFALQVALDAASERLDVDSCDGKDYDAILMWLVSLAIDGPGTEVYSA